MYFGESPDSLLAVVSPNLLKITVLEYLGWPLSNSTLMGNGKFFFLNQDEINSNS